MLATVLGNRETATNNTIASNTVCPHLGILNVHQGDWRTTYKCLQNDERGMTKARLSATGILLNLNIQAKTSWLSKCPFLTKISLTLPHKTISSDLLLYSPTL